MSRRSTRAFEIRAPTQGFREAEGVGLDPGRDLRRPEVGEALRRALSEHALLCIRLEGALDREGFRSVASLFGPVKRPVARARDGSLFRYDPDRQVIDAGFVLTDALREGPGALRLGSLDGDRPGLFEAFHIDDSYTAEPASATVLHARQLPPSGGGNTLFLDLRAGTESLAPGIRERLAGLRAAHAYDNPGAFPARASAEGPAEVLEPVSHPLVRTHPVTGRRALFFDLDRATHVEGLPEDEGRALLQALQDHLEARAPRTEHVWRDHDVLVWDNASVQHAARGDFPVGEPRRFWRHLIEGTRPV